MFCAALHGGEGGLTEAAIATYTEASNSTASSPLFHRFSQCNSPYPLLPDSTVEAQMLTFHSGLRAR